MSTTGNETGILKVECVRDDAYGFVKGEVYSATKAKTKFGLTEMFCIEDENGEEYAYPAKWFKIIE